MPKEKKQQRNYFPNNRLTTFASYFLFQGMRYMTTGERAYKSMLTLVFAIPFLTIFKSFLVCIIFGHCLNFIANGQLPVLMRYIVSDVHLTREKITFAINEMKKTAGRFEIVDILIYGSFCRHSMHSNSDLDLRFYHQPDMKSSVLAYTYATYIRLWANWHYIPIDVYCFSDPSFLDQMRKDENPASIFFSSDMIQKYPKAQNTETALNKNEILK